MQGKCVFVCVYAVNARYGTCILHVGQSIAVLFWVTTEDSVQLWWECVFPGLLFLNQLLH